MKRKFLEILINWKDNNNDPLMVVGARQTGKTYIIEEFCKKNYEQYIYINLEKEEKIQTFFEESLYPQEIIKNIELYKNISINVDRAIIFLDEIQVSERAITSLKYFCEDEKNYHIICAGSLLGVKLNRFNSSFPVGKVTIKHLYPMDFEEFLWAIGKDKLAEEIKK